MGEFEIGVLDDFIAQHYLVGGDFGPEGSLHSHHYRIELMVSGRQLDAHGFLVDIERLRTELGRVVNGLRERTLNDLPEFSGLNPGVEIVARVIGEALSRALADQKLSSLQIRLWESESAWAGYRVSS